MKPYNNLFLPDLSKKVDSLKRKVYNSDPVTSLKAEK